MRTYVNPIAEFMHELDSAIDHAAKEGLPLVGVELTENEWEKFITARCTLANEGLNQEWATRMRRVGFERYKDVKVHVELPRRPIRRE